MDTSFEISKTGDFKFGSWKMHRVHIDHIMEQVRLMFEEHNIEPTDMVVLDLSSDIKKHLAGVRLREIGWISNYAASYLDDEEEITYAVFRMWMSEFDHLFVDDTAGGMSNKMLEYARTHKRFPAADCKEMPKGYAKWLKYIGYENPEKVKLDITIKR